MALAIGSFWPWSESTHFTNEDRLGRLSIEYASCCDESGDQGLVEVMPVDVDRW